MTSAVLLVLAWMNAAPPAFESHWNDWKAELDGYRLVQPRYGQPRDGWAVMVWVMEPFSTSKHVKPDHPEKSPKDTVRVMKLNLIRRFKTGIYDYSLMLSVFSPLVFDEKASGAALRALKTTLSAQDWCGQSFHQLDARGTAVESAWRSYFETQGDGNQSLPLTDDTLLEDELWFRLRALTRPLPPGRYRLLPSLASVRLAHIPLAVGIVDVERATKSEMIAVPAGPFETVRYDLSVVLDGGRLKLARRVWVEKAYPYRIVAWQGDVPGLGGAEPTQERGELTGSLRNTYWQHNRREDDGLRRALRLPE